MRIRTPARTSRTFLHAPWNCIITAQKHCQPANIISYIQHKTIIAITNEVILWICDQGSRYNVNVQPRAHHDGTRVTRHIGSTETPCWKWAQYRPESIWHELESWVWIIFIIHVLTPAGYSTCVVPQANVTVCFRAVTSVFSVKPANADPESEWGSNHIVF
jgi:hypothetical protein